MSSYAHWHAFLYLHTKTCIKTFFHLSHLKSEKKTELNEQIEQEYWNTPSHMSSHAHRHVFLYLHAQTNINTFLFWSYTESKIFKNSGNICRRAFAWIPRSVHVIMLSWASGHIIIGSQKSHLPHPNLPSVRQTSLGNPKLQRCQFPILTTDLKSTVKTAVLSFFQYSN